MTTADPPAPRRVVGGRIGEVGRETVGQPDPIILPDPPALFARRAARFDALSAAHPLADWLRFMARVARAQAQAAMEAGPGVPVAVETAVAARLPPLPADTHARDAAWRAALAIIVAMPDDATLPSETQAVLTRLRQADVAALETLADAYLRGEVPRGETGAALFVAAALQVAFARNAAVLPVAALRLLPQRSRCPVCGSAPVAGVITAAGRLPGARYLHCGLCATAWNHVRAVCTLCGESGGLALHELEGGNGTVKAETCDACHRYAKMLYQAQDMAVDPMADDLASLGLDMKVSEAGWSRATPNPLLLAETG